MSEVIVNENVEEVIEEVVEEPQKETNEVIEEEKVAEEPIEVKEDNSVQKAINKVVKRERRKAEEREAQYNPLIHTIKEGLGINEDVSVAELNERLRAFYKEEGTEITEYRPTENKHDSEVLAKAEAEEIIASGESVMIEEYDRLRNKGELSFREELVLQKIQTELAIKGAEIELSKRGKDSKLLRDKDFVDFASKYRSDISILDIYDDFMKLTSQAPKEVPKPAPSMKGKNKETGIKDFYTPEEAEAFTMEELLANPDILDAIEKSMTKWK